jgi:hypothetical protein
VIAISWDRLFIVAPYTPLEVARKEVPGETTRSRDRVEGIGGGIIEILQGTVRQSGDARTVSPLATTAVYCYRNPEQYIDISDSNQDVWRILYTASGTTVPNPKVPAGTQVTVKIRGHEGFGKAVGFMISDALGPVLAAEQGAFGQGLDAEDGLLVKDIDDDGKILRITSAKTRAGIRSLQIPEWFQPHLASLTKGLPPEAKIFPREKTWLHHHCVSLCKLAGVSRVVPHGLRGVHADLSILAAATPLQVSQALGHTNTGVTFRHYADKGLADQQQHQQAVQTLVPAPTPPN